MQRQVLERRGLPRVRAPEIFKESPEYFDLVLICTCVRGNFLKPGKEAAPESRRLNSCWGADRAGNGSCSHQPEWRQIVTGGASGRILRSILS